MLVNYNNRGFPLTVCVQYCKYSCYLTMSTIRVRGLKAFLADRTNTYSPPPTKRKCAEKAESVISDQLKMKAPRGGSSSSMTAPDGRLLTSQDRISSTGRLSTHRDGGTSTCIDDNITTLKSVLDKRPEVLQGGFHCLQEYTERNTSFAVQKATTLQIFAGSVLRGTKIIEACELAAACTPFSSRTIRRWAKDVFNGYFSTISNLDDVTDKRLELELKSEKGSHPKVFSLMSDENFRKEAKQFVLENGYVKGRPNLTLQQFVTWLKESNDVEICTATASLWLHDMGFSYKQFSKGVYFDGHERDDVVRARELYLEKLMSYSHRMWISHSPAPNPSYSPVIRVFHDESTFHANADQSFHWTDGSNQALKQKSLGQAIMVSDFLDEVNGLLEHDGEKARLLLEHQSEGYFTSDMLVEQVHKAITIFERKYPMAQGIFIFDHAPSHMKRPEDALNPDRMNVKDGGKQPFMRDTMWDGSVQLMVTAEGKQKGMRTVLKERGANIDELNADGLRELLYEYEVMCIHTNLSVQFTCYQSLYCRILLNKQQS